MCSNHIAATTRRGGDGRPFGTQPSAHCGQPGPLVKRLRHRPFTAVTRVRVPYGSPIWRLSSAGRALASHARGHRFEFCSLHQKNRTLMRSVFLLFNPRMGGPYEIPCPLAQTRCDRPTTGGDRPGGLLLPDPKGGLPRGRGVHHRLRRQSRQRPAHRL